MIQMITEITSIEIQNEMDLMLAHRRAMQVCKFAGIGLSEQTRFATAVSEISRNALEYCRGGQIHFNIKNGDGYKCEAVVSDNGCGIKGLEEILKRNPYNYKGRGIGIVFAKNLVDKLIIRSNDKGTEVTLEKNIPPGVPLNALIVQGWIKQFKSEPALSPYEELKNRNMQLMQLTEELKEERTMVNTQMSEIKSLNERLESSNAYMKQFTYSVSHDLKTPLTTLNLALGLIHGSTPDETKRYLDTIEKSSKKLEKTIHGIIEILDIQNNSSNVVRKVILSDAWDEVAEQVFVQYADVDIKITKNFSSVNQLQYIPAYINSILTNLATNAVKYRLPGKQLTIDVSAKNQNGYIVLSFADNGEGIDLTRYGAALFSPFVRFSQTTDGKGIGLYIIKTMVEKNGGKAEVESEVGKGTTFHFFLKEYT